jgi:hypothetical protein
MLSIFRELFIWSIFLSPLMAIGTQFLVLPAGAIELAIGSHAAFGGSSTINPALIQAPPGGPLLSFDNGYWLGDVRISNFHLNQQIGKSTGKFSIRYAGLTDLEFREHKPVDDPQGSFAAFGLTLETGFSYPIGAGQVGFAVRTLYMAIYDQSSTGISLDMGYAKLLRFGWNGGISLLNIGKLSNMDIKAPELPIRLLVGVSKSMDGDKFQNLVCITGEWAFLPQTWQFSFGNNFRWNQFHILTGTSFTDQTWSISTGTGLQLGRYGIFYAVRFSSQDIGIPHTFSISTRLP